VQMDTRLGLAGIWIPTSDMPKKGPVARKTFGYEFLEDDTLFVETKTWEFGPQGKVRIFNQHPEKRDVSIKFGILGRPILDEAKMVNLVLTVTGNGFECVESFPFCPEEEESIGTEVHIPNMQAMYNRFVKFEAMGLDGSKNIVHPKQHLTVRGFKYIMDNYFEGGSSKSEGYTLAYIGTDTTENIRSLFRSISAHKWEEVIKEIRFFFTTEWDEEFLPHTELEEQIRASYPNINYRFRELSDETARLQEKLEKCDVVISTYVAPWINDRNKNQFKTLLNNIMGDTSYLLSVDPKTGQNSVRSELSNANINNDALFLDELKYITAKAQVTNENNSVEWGIWKKPASGDIS
jgi:hypothetical protein